MHIFDAAEGRTESNRLIYSTMEEAILSDKERTFVVSEEENNYNNKYYYYITFIFSESPPLLDLK